MAYCRKCGAEIGENDTVCTRCGAFQVQEVISRPAVNPNDKKSFGFWLLGFLMPFVGLVLYIAWKGDRPKRAKSVGTGALVQTVISIVLAVVLCVAIAVGSIAAAKTIATEGPEIMNSILGALEGSGIHFNDDGSMNFDFDFDGASGNLPQGGSFSFNFDPPTGSDNAVQFNDDGGIFLPQESSKPQAAT